MPAHVELSSALERELLRQLGARLKHARLARKIAVSASAQTLMISRTTLYAVESGDPSVTMGTYMRVLSALGMVTDIVLVATGIGQGQTAQLPPLPERSGLSEWGSHRRQDRRSLALHQEAVKALRKEPARAQRALDVLDRWETSADAHSQPLRDEWRRIIEHRLWDLALEDSDRGNQLRQASPLGFVLEPSVHSEILRRFSREAIRESSPA